MGEEGVVDAAAVEVAGHLGAEHVGGAFPVLADDHVAVEAGEDGEALDGAVAAEGFDAAEGGLDGEACGHHLVEVGGKADEGLFVGRGSAPHGSLGCGGEGERRDERGCGIGAHGGDQVDDRGVVGDGATESATVAGVGGCHRGGAERGARDGDGVVDAREVDDVAHDGLEAVAERADAVGDGALEIDLAARHGAGAEFVFEAADHEVVGCAAGQILGDEEEAESGGAFGAVGVAGSHEDEVGACVAAEPLLAVDGEAAVCEREGACVAGADVAAALYLGEELGAVEAGLVGAREEAGEVGRAELGRADSGERGDDAGRAGDGAVVGRLAAHGGEGEEGEAAEQATLVGEFTHEPRLVDDATRVVVAGVVLDLFGAVADGVVALEAGEVPGPVVDGRSLVEFSRTGRAVGVEARDEIGGQALRRDERERLGEQRFGAEEVARLCGLPGSEVGASGGDAGGGLGHVAA